ncbi:MAG TPA: FGGY-family carbohydrate kinase [Mycobacteriales bacterium]|nr:FGGY-family carbohydrate kinase [Mycobacteriales bacterium]
MTDVLLGVDIGTASSKGIAVTADGSVLATAVRQHDLSTPHPGWAEHDAERVWWADFTSIVSELTAATEHPIVGLGVSGIGPCLVPTDADGTPLRPAILYGVDTRAGKEITELTSRYGTEQIIARCGSPLTSQAVGPKLLWLRGNEPEVWDRTRRFYMASSLIVHRLTGTYVLDHHSASQCTPLYDQAEHTWISEWAEDIAPGLQLPDLAWPGDVVGEVQTDIARDLGLPPGTPVIAGTIDAWAEAVSAGVTAPGDVMLMYGTTMFMVEVLAQRRTWPTLWGTVGVVPDTFNLAAGMATSGAITDWLRRLTGSEFPTLVEEAAQAGIGADGLLMLPYFAGERTPLFDADARGVIVGLTTRHDRGHLYRAALEATAFGVRHNLEAMREAGGEDRRLVGVGGGTKGGLWTQIVSDVLGEEQQLPRETIGACYGDAMLAAEAVGAASRTSSWNPIETVVRPDSAAHELYDQRYRMYRDLYPATATIAHQLAELQG